MADNTILEPIFENVPSEFFRQLIENTDAAFSTATLLSHHYIKEPEQANILGQLRHALCEKGFRDAAHAHGLHVSSPHTNPPGGRYSLVEGNGIIFVRANNQKDCGPPRPTKFRRQWASCNQYLEPLQFNLLENTGSLPSNKLCAMIVTTAHSLKSGNGDPSVPAWIGLGIPYSDLSNWKLLKSIPEILSLYHDRDTAASRKTLIEPAEIKDTAIPRLKPR